MFEKFVKYLIKQKTIIQMKILLEFLPILIEAIGYTYFLLNNNNYIQNSDKYLKFSSPYHLIKIKFDLYDSYIQDIYFYIFLLFHSVLIIIIIIMLYSEKIKKQKIIHFKDFHQKSHESFMVQVIYYFLINYFDIIARIFSIFIIFTFFIKMQEKILLNNIIDFFIVFILYLIFVSLNLTYIQNYNIFVIFNKNLSYPYDYNFSRKYDLFLFYIKHIIAFENILDFFSEINMKKLIYVRLLVLLSILLFSFIILVFIINKSLLLVINKKLNIFRIFLLVLNGVSIIFIFIMNKSEGMKYLVFIFFGVILCSIAITMKIKHRIYHNIYETNNKVYQLIFVLNRKCVSAFDKAEESIKEILLIHKIKCERDKCNMCFDSNIENFYSNFLDEIENEILYYLKTQIIDKEHLFYYDVSKILYNMDKKTSLFGIYKIKKLIRKYSVSDNKIIINNLNLFLKYLTKNNIEKYEEHNVIQCYLKTITILKQTNEKMLNFLSKISTQTGNNIIVLSRELEKAKKYVKKNMLYLRDKKAISQDDYVIILIKQIYEFFFNVKINKYGGDIMEDFLENVNQHFKDDKFILLNYSFKQNTFEILKVGHELISYLNKKLFCLFPNQFEVSGHKLLLKSLLKNAMKKDFLYDFLIRLDDEFIRMIQVKFLIIPSFYMRDILLEGKYFIDNASIVVFKKYKKSYLMTLKTFSHDLFSFFYLYPSWINYLNSRNCELIFEGLFKKTLENNNIYTFNYHEYSLIYKSISYYLKDNYDEDLINKYIDELQYLSVEKAGLSVSIDLQYTIDNDKVSYYVYKCSITCKTNQHQTIYTNIPIPSCDNDIAFTNLRKRQYNTLHSYNSLVSLTNESHNMTLNNFNNNKNTNNLTTYSKFSLVVNFFIIICCIVFLFTGVRSFNKLKEVHNIKENFNNSRQYFMNSYLALFFISKNYNNTNNYDFNDYFIHSQTNFNSFIKEDIRYNLYYLKFYFHSFYAQVYSSYFNKQLVTLLDKNFTYYYFSNINNLLSTNFKIFKFYDSITQFLNNGEVIINSVDEILLDTFTFNHSYFDYSNLLKFSRNKSQIAMYEIIINYIQYDLIFRLINTQLENFYEQQIIESFNNIYYFSIGFIVGHLILILICFIVLKNLQKIILANNKIYSELLTSEKVKFLKQKFEALSNLYCLYSYNPTKAFKSVKSIQKNSKLYTEQIKVLKEYNQKEYFEKINKNYNENLKIDTKLLIKPIIKYISFAFIFFFIYSGLFLIIFSNYFKNLMKINDLYNLQISNNKNLFNNVLLLQISLITNSTGSDISYEYELDSNEYIEYNLAEFSYNKIIVDKTVNIYSSLLSVKEFNSNFMDCEFVFKNLSNLNYSNQENQNFVLNFISICNSFNLTKFSLDNLINNNIFIIRKILHWYKEHYNDLDNIKNILGNKEFYELLFVQSYIIRSISYYVENYLLGQIINSNFNSFLFFIILYLLLNLFIDCAIMAIITKGVVRKVIKVNDYIKSFTNCLKC